jgi:murein DD-endopeptidase MepM/ murein hydrolase activator NlpD
METAIKKEFFNLAHIDFGRRGPNVVRLVLVCTVFVYFPLVSMHLQIPLSQAMRGAGYALQSTLFPGKADMGGMETSYAESGYNELYPQGASYESTEGDALAANVIDTGALEPEEFSAPVPLLFFAHTLEKGDMIGNLAIKYGLNEGTLISLNSIRNTRAIQAGKQLKIPNQDGIIHKVSSGETLKSIAEKYEVRPEPLLSANELFSEKVNVGTSVFVPGAKMNEAMLQEINGDLFIRPIRGRFTSAYGWRRSPISGVRSFHRGIDLAAPTGTPIGAGMAGRVTSVGFSAVFGNYVIVSHHSNYRTLYAHMSSVKTRTGAYVSTGQTIGYVGNTGQSTGPHLHFEVYKNGITVNPTLLMH